MNTHTIFFEIPEEVYETFRSKYDSKEIGPYCVQFLSTVAEIPGLLPNKLFFDELKRYLNNRERALACYPEKIKGLMLRTLNEVAPSERWVLIKDITDHFNRKLVSSGTNSKPYSPRKAANLLSVLGFTRRSRPGQLKRVLVEQAVMQRYNDSIGALHRTFEIL